MRHPNSRAERRAVRDAYVARRRFIAQHIWSVDSFSRPPYEHEHWYFAQGKNWEPFEWGKYAKYNLNCGCMMCHWEKHNERRARRAALDQAIFDNLNSWEDR